jgi:predicted phage tail protein
VKVSFWDGFHSMRIVLMIAAIAVVIISLLVPPGEPRIGVFTVLAGALAACVAGYQIESPPGTSLVNVDSAIQVGSGAWIALIAGAVMVAGGVLQLWPERPAESWTEAPRMDPAPRYPELTPASTPPPGMV